MSTLSAAPIPDAPVVGEAAVDVEDEWHAVITFAGGVRLTWTFCRLCPGEDTRYGKYYGSKGMMSDQGFSFHPFQGGGEAVLADGTVVTQEQISQEYLASLTQGQKDALFPYGAEDGFSIEVYDFVRAVATGKPPEMDGHAGLQAKALCIACYEAATLGEPVRFDDVLAGTITTYQDPIDEYWQFATA